MYPKTYPKLFANIIKRRPRSIIGLTGMALAFALASPAYAQGTVPPPPSNPPAVGGTVGYFGERGQIVISGDMKFNVQRQSASMGADTVNTYELSPALDYFVSTNVSAGALVGIRKDFDDLVTIRVAPRVGYNLFLSNDISLWIRAGLAYEHYSLNDLSGYTLAINVYPTLLWHPVSHFFIGAGPYFETDFVAKFDGRDVGKTTLLGLSSTIGGYFGGM